MPPTLGERLDYPSKAEAVSHNVAQGGKEMVPDKKEQKKISKEEFEQYKKKLQGILEANRAMLETFSGDASLKYIVADKYAIDFEKGTVYLDATTMHEKGETEEQAFWSILHELSHFKDYIKDRAGIMDNFKHIQRKAKKLAPVLEQKCIEAFSATNPEILEKMKERKPSGSKMLEPMNWYEQAGYRMYHTFYNSLDDVHVNARVSWEMPRFQADASGGKAIRELYRDKLFPMNDVAEYPKHLQLHDKLLREFMVPEQNMIVTEHVLEAVEQPMPFMGVKRKAKEWVQEVLVPGIKKNKKTGKNVLKDTKASSRNAVLRQVIEPLFDKLLMEDLEHWQPKLPEKSSGGAGSEAGEGEPAGPFEQAYEDHKTFSPDQVPEHFFDDLSERVIHFQEQKKKEQEEEEKRKKEDATKSTEQRAQENKDRADREWCERNGVSYEQFRQYAELEREVAPYLEELSNLWTKILRGMRVEESRGMEGFFRTGELNVPKTVEEWANIESGKFDEVRVMERQQPKETLVRKPDEIRIRLLGDNSGSMSGEKAKMVQLVSTLILSSVQEFNARMAWEGGEGNAVKAKSQVVSYGSGAVVSKELESTGEQEKADMVKAVTAFDANGGGTVDAAALREVWETIKTPEEQEKIKSGKVIDIVFEITDGGTQSLYKTVVHKEDGSTEQIEGSIELLDKIKKSGVITKAFFVGAPHPTYGGQDPYYENDLRTFKTEWKDDGKIVGNDLASVVPTIAKMLEEIIGEKF